MNAQLTASVHSWTTQEAGNYVRGVVLGSDEVPQSGYGVQFSAVGPGVDPALEHPDITGPHPGYADWPPGYYSTILHIPGVVQHVFWLLLVNPDTGQRLSDVAIIDNTQGPGQGKSQCVCDWSTQESDPDPDPVPDPPPSGDPLADIRNAAWRKIGIPYNPNAAFPLFARRYKQGNPVTREFDVAGYRAQGFQGGIILAPIGNYDNINWIPW